MCFLDDECDEKLALHLLIPLFISSKKNDVGDVMNHAFEKCLVSFFLFDVR